ncbi:MAG: hypothetical protein R8K22_07805 [Mariprofundaceae bacterium]
MSKHMPKTWKPPYTLICLMGLQRTLRGGLFLLLAAFLINCYFMLFDQQHYIAFVAYFSPDGSISDIGFIFPRILAAIIGIAIAWVLITNNTFVEALIRASKDNWQPELPWHQTSKPYVIACAIWLMVSYLPLLILDLDTMKMLEQEDSFYENIGFMAFLVASILFFLLSFKARHSKNKGGLKSTRNIVFLLLGLLFFFAAGEEISWGQRIFDFGTPEILNANIQHESNIHNLPVFDERIDTHTVKTGLLGALSMRVIFNYFWLTFCVIIPVLYSINNRTRDWLNQRDFPTPPLWIGPFFIANFLLYALIFPLIYRYIEHPTRVEHAETLFSFLFFMLALWFYNQSKPLRNP